MSNRRQIPSAAGREREICVTIIFPSTFQSSSSSTSTSFSTTTESQVAAAGTGKFNMAETADGVSVAPLRTLDDFILESSRFQVPNLKDPEKWSNRVSQNLLYYQTNYFLTYMVVFALVA